MRTIKNILLYLWQLQQNLLGLVLVCVYNCREIAGKPNLIRRIEYKGKKVYIYERFPGGISCGNYVLVDFYRKEKHSESERMRLSDSINHEYGHCRQSKRWGPLYLPIPGLVSLTHNIFCDCRKHKHGSYYNIWPENEADRLGGVKRK